MKPLLDINVVLDLLLVRQPWLVDAEQVWDAHRNGLIKAAIAAFTLPTIFYLMRRGSDLAHAHDAVRLCLATFEIVPVQRSTLELARTFTGNDFEDNLQIACAVEVARDCIVTRDPSGYLGSPIPVLSPSDLAARIAKRTP